MRGKIAGALLGCGVLACGAPAGESAGTGDAPAAAATVRLKVQGGFAFSMPVLGETVAHFRDSMAAMQVTGLELKVYDANKLVGTLGIFDAVSAGKIDAGFAFPGYWLGKVPAAAVFGAVPFGPDARESLAWLHKGGGLELWREIYAKRNLVPIPCGALPPEASGWFSKPIESVDDLVGLKVRYAGLGGKVLEKLGASATQIPAGDIFVSLERGVIDATEYSLPVIDRNLGPLILEMNARPGLNIQIANGAGLAHRIGRIDQIADASADPITRALVARREFVAEKQARLPLGDD